MEMDSSPTTAVAVTKSASTPPEETEASRFLGLPDEILELILQELIPSWWIETPGICIPPSGDEDNKTYALPELPWDLLLVSQRVHQLSKRILSRSFNGLWNVRGIGCYPVLPKKWYFVAPFIRSLWLADGSETERPWPIMDLPSLETIEWYNDCLDFLDLAECTHETLDELNNYLEPESERFPGSFEPLQVFHDLRADYAKKWGRDIRIIQHIACTMSENFRDAEALREFQDWRVAGMVPADEMPSCLTYDVTWKPQLLRYHARCDHRERFNRCIIDKPAGMLEYLNEEIRKRAEYVPPQPPPLWKQVLLSFWNWTEFPQLSHRQW